MKRKHNYQVCLLLIAIVLGNNVSINAQPQFGIRAGANFSNILLKDGDGNKGSTDIIPGFHIGATVDIGLINNVYFQPAVLFTTKGYSLQQTISGITVKGTETPYYVEMPLNFLFKPNLGAGRLLIGIGPYISYGVGGKWGIKATEGSSSLSQKGKLIFKNDMSDALMDSTSGGAFDLAEKQVYAKPFDAGAGILAGYEFGNMYIQLNGQLGLINIMPTVKNIDTKGIQKNRQFGISVGYKF